MGKYITNSQVRGALGESFIRSTVLRMGHIFECIRTDAGLDGTIELRDRTTCEMLNLILRIQVKATSSFRSETENSFSFVCEPNDIEYWLKGNTPNILVVCNPETEIAYWKSIRDYFSTPELKLSRTVRFDKKADLFDHTTGDKLFHLARPANSGLYMEAPHISEVLTSNLMEVKRIPTTVYIAPTKCETLKEAYAKARSEGAELPPEILLTDRTLISVHDFREDNYWRLVCDTNDSEHFNLTERFDFSDNNDRRLISELLHKCLRGLGRSSGLRYIYGDRLFYVDYVKSNSSPMTGKFSASKVSPAKRKRGLVLPLGGKSKGFKHCAFEADFLCVEDTWFMQLSPSYHYTYDGRHKKHNAAEFLANIKRLERHRAVLSQLRLWEEFLCEAGSGDLLAKPYPHLSFGPLKIFNIDRSVPDRLWHKEELSTDSEEELF